MSERERSISVPFHLSKMFLNLCSVEKKEFKLLLTITINNQQNLCKTGDGALKKLILLLLQY